MKTLKDLKATILQNPEFKAEYDTLALAPQNLYQITSNVADMNTVLIERAELHRLQAENAELEAMLDAVGAGGVGQSIKPQIQADTSPAAWAIYSDDGTAIRLWSKDKATAQKAADKFGRPLVPLYTAPQPTRQPLTKARIDELYKECNKEVAKLDAEHRYIFGGWFPVAVRLIEKAHGITGGQP